VRYWERSLNPGGPNREGVVTYKTAIKIERVLKALKVMHARLPIPRT